MQAERLASFCLLTGQAPEVYFAITLRERNAFVRVANKRAVKRKRKR